MCAPPIPARDDRADDRAVEFRDEKGLRVALQQVLNQGRVVTRTGRVLARDRPKVEEDGDVVGNTATNGHLHARRSRAHADWSGWIASIAAWFRRSTRRS